jgi:hypothetical protein
MNLASPFSIVELDVDGHDLQAAVAGARSRGPLVLAAVNSDRLKEKK